MPEYSYTGLDDTGKKVSGVLNFPNEGALEAKLRSTGVWLISAQRRRRSQVANYVTQGRRYKTNRRDLITFFIQITLLLNAGIPIVQALERLEDDFTDEPLGPVITGLKEQISNGTPLHEAMDAFPRIFSPQMTSLIKAGEASGTLPNVLDNLRHYLEWLETLQGDIRQAVTYPLVVMLAVIGLVFVLMVYVVPQFAQLFKSMNMEIPTLTRIVMGTSGFISATWFVWLGLLVGGPIAFHFLCKVEAAAIAIDEYKLRLPLFGEMIQMFALSRFSHNLAMMYKAGIPLTRALEISRNIVGNKAISRALGRVLRGVIEGNPMSKIMAGEKVFSKALITMLASGEASGKLDVALESVSDYYNSIIPRKIKVFFSLFEPAVMFILIGVVGAVALALILPILQLWEAAGG
jgi:type II secretory pathway component PulF